MKTMHSRTGWSSLSPAAVRAYKRVVQYVHRHQLAPGDRLPVQQELRVSLGLTNDALTRAMAFLCRQGVLERKSKIGTRVVDPGKASDIPWRIGLANIAAPEIGPLSMFSALAHALQIRCARAGWSVLTYYKFCQSPGHPTLDQFGDLEYDLHERLLDGLILLTPAQLPQWNALTARDLALCHTPFWEQAPCGVIVDQAHMVTQAVQRMLATGCRQLATVAEELPGQPQPRYWRAFTQTLTQAVHAVHDGQALEGGIGIGGGRALGQRLLEMPRKARPDGLIVFDDYIALGLADVLREALDSGSGYQPQIAVQAHRQLPLSYGLPVIRFDVDLHGLADAVFHVVHQRLLNPDGVEQMHFVQPEMTAQASGVAEVPLMVGADPATR